MLAILNDKVVVSPSITHFTERKNTFIIIANIMSALMLHLLIVDSLYNKSTIQYLISLDGEVVLANCGITGPESNLIYWYHFKVTFVKNWNNASEKLSKTLWWNKIKYIWQEISKSYISDKEIHKYMFTFLLNDFCSNIFF